jgi:hypothetical protein
VHRVDEHGISAGRKVFADRKQALRVLVGERLEEHGVDQREDGGVGPDADGE